MSDEQNKSDIKIDGDVATWKMRLEGEIRGTYVGTFKFKCFLLPTERIAANREYREQLGINPTVAGEHESALAYALAQLKYRILEAPPFWTATLSTSKFAGDIEDENIINSVLAMAMESEFIYRDLVKKKKEEAIQKSKAIAEDMRDKQDEEEPEDEDEAEEGAASP